MKRIILLMIVLFCLSLYIGINVYAENTDPCAADKAKFCKWTNNKAKCLGEHEKELSPACQKRRQDIAELAKKMQQVCAADMDKFCKEKNLFECVSENEDKMSPECINILGKMGIIQYNRLLKNMK